MGDPECVQCVSTDVTTLCNKHNRLAMSITVFGKRCLPRDISCGGLLIQRPLC